MDALTAFGLFAVTAMLVTYALEDRGQRFILAFACACALGSAYGFLQGAWPFGFIEDRMSFSCGGDPPSMRYEGCRDSPSRASSKEGEPWSMVALLTSVWTHRSCGTRWRSRRPAGAGSCAIWARSTTRQRRPGSWCASWRGSTRR